MASNLEIVKNSSFLNMAIYDYEGFEKVTWDYLETTNSFSIYWGLKTIDNVDYFIFRGSYTFLDWIKDFCAIENPFYTAYGTVEVHPGFHFGTPEVYQRMKPMIKGDYIVSGHSKGAGEADNIVVAGCLAKKPPIARIVFGEPRPGDKAFGALMQAVPGFSLINQDANGHDEIVDVPFDIWPESYQHPGPLFKVSETPQPNDPWGVFAYHHMQLYYAAVQKLTASTLDLHHAVSEFRKMAYFEPALIKE